MALTRLGRHAEALEAYAVSLEYERLPATLNNRAASLLNLRRFDDMAKDVLEALQLAPGLPGAFFNLGCLFEALRLHVDAAQAYQNAFNSKPDFLEAYLTRGFVLLRIGEFNAALANFDRALALAAPTLEQQATVSLPRADALMRLGRADEALAATEKAIAEWPHNVDAWHVHGLALRYLGRLEEARAAFSEGLRLDPNCSALHHDLALSKRFAPDDPQIDHMRRLAEAPAASADDELHLRFALGKAADDLGDPDSAFASWARANALERQANGYDESATLGRLTRTRDQFSRSYIAERRGGGLRGARPIFVFGLPRSGTTLIEQILASHSETFGAGETDDFARVVSHITVDGVGGFPFPDVAARLSARDTAVIGEAYMRFVSARDSRGLRPIDKTTNNYLFAGLIALAVPDARFVHTRRNAADCCLSCFSKKFTGVHGYTNDLADLGRYYRAYHALMAHWRDALPDGVMIDVDYESLVADQEGETRRLLAHCDLPFDPRCLEFYKTERQVQTASASQVREPIYRRAIERWRPYEPYLGPLLEELGPLAESH